MRRLASVESHGSVGFALTWPNCGPSFECQKFWYALIVHYGCVAPSTLRCVAGSSCFPNALPCIASEIPRYRSLRHGLKADRAAPRLSRGVPCRNCCDGCFREAQPPANLSAAQARGKDADQSSATYLNLTCSRGGLHES